MDMLSQVLAMTRIRTGIARRPDGPEDANPMNRRLPAEVREDGDLELKME